MPAAKSSADNSAAPSDPRLQGEFYMKTYRFIFFTLLLGLGLLAGCSSQTAQTEQNQPESDGGLEKIVMAEPVRGYHWAQAYLAETLGYFEEEGLDVEFQTIRGSDPTAALLSGDVQFCLKGNETPLLLAERGKGSKALVSFTQGYPFQLVSAGPEYSTLESLRGKAISGGRSENSGPSTFAKACFNDAGVDADKEISYINMLSSDYASAMERGELQAAVGTTPWGAKLLRDRGGVVLVDGTDRETMQKLTGSGTVELFILMATDDYIDAHPEQVQKVVNAIVKAMQWMEAASPEEIAAQLSPLFQSADEELLYDAQYDKEHQIASYTGYHTESGYRASVALQKKAGGITKDYPAEQMYDESFLDTAWKTLGK